MHRQRKFSSNFETFKHYTSFWEILEHWESQVVMRKVFGALLTNLSKACDCLLHELMIAKLNAYGFGLSPLKLTQNYLSKGQQRTKINLSYSLWKKCSMVFPEGPILCPVFLNIVLSDRFLLSMMSILLVTQMITPYINQLTV